MLSRLDDSCERSIFPEELHCDEILLSLRPVAAHTTHHGHIGTEWEAAEYGGTRTTDPPPSFEGTMAGIYRQRERLYV
jgi:hypothetical protein